MKRYDYSRNSDKTLGAGIAACISSLIFFGGSVLIYFLKLYKNRLVIVEAIFMWFTAIILFLAGVSLVIWGMSAIILNIKLKLRKQPTPKDSRNVWVNTDPVAGIIAFLLGIGFVLLNVLSEYPEYKAGETSIIGVIFYLVSSILLIIYAFFVFLYNILKKH